MQYASRNHSGWRLLASDAARLVATTGVNDTGKQQP
jgi:hypothetical protein